MLMRPTFHSVNWFQIQMTELHIAFRRYPQECPLTSGIKKEQVVIVLPLMKNQLTTD